MGEIFDIDKKTEDLPQISGKMGMWWEVAAVGGLIWGITEVFWGINKVKNFAHGGRREIRGVIRNQDLKHVTRDRTYGYETFLTGRSWRQGANSGNYLCPFGLEQLPDPK